jgi:uncharacterized protein YutE (UPF0331/DUF86 family)
MKITKKEDLLETEKYYAISMVLFSIINRSIDIANEFVSGSGIPIPGTYKDAFGLLEKHNVISKSNAENMGELVKYRNIIAHEYYELNAEKLWKIKNACQEAKIFIEEIKKYLKRK